MDGEVTVAILREIRDGVRETRDEVKKTRSDLSARIDQTNARIDETNTRLGRVEERLEKVEATLQDLAAQQLMLTRYVKNVVDRHEEAIAELRERLAQLETKIDRDA